MIDLNKYTSKEDLFKFLKENKSFLVAQKKNQTKEAQPVHCPAHSINDKSEATKSMGDSSELLSKDKISVRSVINTTNLLDSHGDVHIKGLWKKSLKEQKSLYLLQEHQMKFDHIISDEVKASTVKMKWSDLCIDLNGETEALVFDSEIEKVRNPYMFEQYARG